MVGCGDTDEEAMKDHDRKLLEFMDRCREVKLRHSLKKLQFRVREVKFHGHILSAEELRVDTEKVRAVQDMPLPTDAKAVQRLIGFMAYLAKFTPHLSEVCEPLRRLLDRDVPWHWLPKHDAAVEEIKRLVTAAPILRYYDVTKPVTIQSDASLKGLGCCLLQEGQPIGYASRALTQTEQNYAQFEKDVLCLHASGFTTICTGGGRSQQKQIISHFPQSSTSPSSLPPNVFTACCSRSRITTSR